LILSSVGFGLLRGTFQTSYVFFYRVFGYV